MSKLPSLILRWFHLLPALCLALAVIAILSNDVVENPFNFIVSGKSLGK